MASQPIYVPSGGHRQTHGRDAQSKNIVAGDLSRHDQDEFHDY